MVEYLLSGGLKLQHAARHAHPAPSPTPTLLTNAKARRGTPFCWQPSAPFQYRMLLSLLKGGADEGVSHCWPISGTVYCSAVHRCKSEGPLRGPVHTHRCEGLRRAVVVVIFVVIRRPASSDTKHVFEAEAKHLRCRQDPGPWPRAYTDPGRVVCQVPALPL